MSGKKLWLTHSISIPIPKRKVSRIWRIRIIWLGWRCVFLAVQVNLNSVDIWKVKEHARCISLQTIHVVSWVFTCATWVKIRLCNVCETWLKVLSLTEYTELLWIAHADSFLDGFLIAFEVICKMFTEHFVIFESYSEKFTILEMVWATAIVNLWLSC